ncbi:cysteine hydrolase family protein [Lysobacter gummosus]|uniref:cysteine hydrolase family protein n=1 Tax=Lysobacter gummosus TaxID=262324 RepID=UPI0036386251
MPSKTALLILDMINPFDFANGPALARAASRIAPRIAAVKRAIKAEAGACIYINDNFGRWQSDLRELILRAQLGRAAGVLDHLHPQDDDHFVLKPKHSAFFQSPLPLLLQATGARRLVVTGVAAEACVLATALDAHMREYEVHVPSDCVASLRAPLKSAALSILRNADIVTAAYRRGRRRRAGA